MIIFLYRLTLIILLPVALILMLKRYINKKETKTGFYQKFSFGYKDYKQNYPEFFQQKAAVPEKTNNPQIDTVWIHGSSVGETGSILQLINKLKSANKGIRIVVTSGTKNAEIFLKKQLPKDVIHCYAPLDFYFSVHRFLKFFSPKVSIFVDSEFWPEMLHQAPNPILLNGRVSDRSAKQHQKWGFLIRPFVQNFKACFATSRLDKERLEAIGVQNISLKGSLKFDKKDIEINHKELQKLKGIIGSEKEILTAASTHEGEEILITRLHQKWKEKHPSLLTIIAPRHPERGDAIKQQIEKIGAKVAQRSKGEIPTAETDIYLADTIGELPLFYEVANAVFIGGSFIPHGGQNPIEPLHQNRITFCGPYMENFREVVATLKEKGVLFQTQTEEELYAGILTYLQNPTKRKEQEQKTAEAMKGLGGATDAALKLILDTLRDLNET